MEHFTIAHPGKAPIQNRSGYSSIDNDDEDQDNLPASARERAVHMLSELVGAIILARAVAQANLSLSDEILEAVSTDLQTQMKQTTPMNE